MYKDVWKKFGAKVLIVLCSVLLLGGVAIAAPKLKAAQQEPMTVGQLSSIIANSPGAIVVVTSTTSPDTDNNGKPVYAGKDVSVEPKAFKVEVGGQTFVFDDTNDFEVVGQRVNTTCATKDEKDKSTYASVYIQGKGGKLTASSDGNFQARMELKYVIEKKSVGGSGYFIWETKPGTTEDVSKKEYPLVVQTLPYVVKSSDFELWYSADGIEKTEKLEESKDYDFTDDASHTINNLGESQGYKVNLRNYKVGTSSELNLRCHALKHVDSLQFLLDGYQYNKYKRPSDKPENYRPTLTVYDAEITYDNDGKATNLSGKTPLTDGTAYQSDTSEDGFFGIKGLSNYIGTKTISYEITTKEFNPICEGYGEPLDYDKAAPGGGHEGDFRKPPSAVYNQVKNADGSVSKVLLASNEYKIDDVDYSIQQGTAGKVTVKIHGLGDYKGQEGTDSYFLQRNLANLNDVTMSMADDGCGADKDKDCVFDNTTHKREPILKLKGSDYELKRENGDFTVSYELTNAKTPSLVQKPEDHYKYAGDVKVTVTGTITQGEKGKGGYYGTLKGGEYDSSGQKIGNLMYKINQRPVGEGSDGLFKIVLDQDVYDLMYTEPDVKSHAHLVFTSSNTEYNIDMIDNNYEISYTDLQGNPVVWSAAEGDAEYYIVYSFHGNFTGDLKAKFRVTAINPSKVSVTIPETCKNDLQGVDKTHTYTGKPHLLTDGLQVTYEGRVLTGYEIGYKRGEYSDKWEDYTTYKANPQLCQEICTDAGDVRFAVKLAGKKGALIAKPDDMVLTIAPRPLSSSSYTSSKLAFDTKSSEFTKKSGSVWHEYSGRYNVPDVPALNLTVAGASASLELPMVKGKDFDEVTNNSMFTGGSVVTDLDTIAVDKTTEYCFKINGRGNFVNDDTDGLSVVFTENFKFDARDLGSEEIGYEPITMDYSSSISQADCLSHIEENITVTDSKFPDGNGKASVLRNPERDASGNVTSGDFKIEFDSDWNKINVNGTIEFTIKGVENGCYKGQYKEKCVLNVGKDIATTKVKEVNSTDAIGFVNRVRQFNRNYLHSNGNILNFSTSQGQSNDSKYSRVYDGSRHILMGTAGSDGQVTDENGKYTVNYGDPVPDEKDPVNGKMACTAVLQGVNGYYGTATINFWLERQDLEAKKDGKAQFEIRFLEEPEPIYYTGEPIKPIEKLQLWYIGDGKDKEKLIDNSDNNCYNIIDSSWKNNTNANVSATNPTPSAVNMASVTIEGKNSYRGKLTGYFRIYPRPINDENSENMSSLFTLNNWESIIKYRPFTGVKADNGSLTSVTGAWQDVELAFKADSGAPGEPKVLEYGTLKDYTYKCVNAEHVGDDAYIEVTGHKNFTGTFIQKYSINRASFGNYVNSEEDIVEKETDFLILINNKKDWQKFSGHEIVPEITVEQLVWQKADGKMHRYTLTKDKDYKLTANQSTFVSHGAKGESTTYVSIKGVENGNYEDEGRASYVIYGDISPSKDPDNAVSRLVIDGKEDWKKDGNRVEIPYNLGSDEPIAFDAISPVLQQRSYKEDGSLPNWGTQGYSDEYRMEYDVDYTVSCTKQIGYYVAKVKGTGNEQNKGSITGADDVPVTIWASLNDLQVDESAYPVLWQNNGGTNVIKCTSGSSITPDYLASKLTIKFGTKTLEYNRDYKFEGDVNANLGDFTSIRIVPTDYSGKDDKGRTGYLRDDTTITYKLVSDLTNNADVPELGTFEYAHGFQVFDPAGYDFNITADGVKLYNGVNYDVTITNDKNEPAEPINCGSYKAVISGKGQYGGEIIRTFQIVPYSFTDHQADVRITFESDSVTFTGKNPTLPVVTKVEVFDGSKAGYVDVPADGYTVKAGSNGGDNVNWTDTSDPNVIMPQAAIVGAGSNYVGSAVKEYRIKKKNISDSDVEIADILGLEYQNGNEITPYPDITYWIDKTAGQEDSMKLQGIRYVEADADKYGNWKEWSTHFTYQYMDNTTTIGEKHIQITGIGNFTGKTEKAYTVSPLSLKNTKLRFVSDTWPTYDGTEQKPSFEMIYGDVVILKCTNGKVTSDLLMNTGNVHVEFGNNINATDAEHPATIKITMDGSDNYVDSKDAEFTILQASLKDHVKFMYHLKGQKDNTDLRGYKLNLPWVNTETTVQPVFARGIVSESDIEEEQLGIFYDFAGKANHGKFLELDGQRGEAPTGDYTIEYRYVEPDSEDVDVREGYGNEHQPPCSYAGKVKVTLTGMGNYTDSASFWYYIGTDISSVGTAKLKTNTTVFNSQIQTPILSLSGITEDECTIAFYKNEAVLENLITKDDFVHAGTYYVRIEGKPWAGTYASKPQTFTYTITARPLSSAIVIDGFKKEYSYTGNPICPVGISVTDYIDKIKYRLTEDVDYSLTYANNLNAGTAVITVVGQNDYSGSATAKFTITSSTISSGGANNGGSLTDGSGELSGTMAVKPEDVKLSMDTSDAMYYTGNQLRPGVSIAGMTENVDYTVTYSNNVEVGTGIVTITGIKNNTGTITKMFRIIAPLSKCTVAPIPDQQHTGSPVTPTITIRCGNSILVEGTDYTVSYANNVNIGTATVTIRSANNSNYTGSTTATFHIGNNIGAFIISGYAPSYTYTGKAITPGVVVESGNSRLTQGVDYTVSYANNTNAGTATITVTGIGKYSGTQTANFIIEGKSIESCDTTGVTDKTYTGDAYTPSITVSDNGTVLKNGVDYILTYVNNTNPGTASILVQGMSNNYVGTKIISFKIAGVPIKGLKAAAVKYNSIKLSWTKQSYADGYQICDSKSKVVKNVTKNSATITKLSAGKTYKYKVRSYIRNSDGSRSYGAFSPVLSATTKLKTPSVKITSTKKGQARISWSKVSGATGYEIYYKKSKGAKYKKLKTINKANVRICTVRGLKSGDRCYFRVRAFKKSGSKKVYSALNPLKVITIK